MSNETESDIRLHVSNCFNHRGYRFDGETLDESGYQQLSRLMIEEYDLSHYDVDGIVGDIEEMVARYIMEWSPKFQDKDDDI
jgi:hypothetical protein